MKQLVFAILAVAMLLPMKALSATLSIEDFTIKPGETKEMLIDVNNADMQVTMVEFYMHLPSGLSVATENGDLAVDIAGRTTWKKHSLEAQLNSGVLHVLLYSGSNATLSDTSGAVISVKLTAASSFTGGNITLKQQLLAAPDETESKPADYTYKVTTGVSDAVTLTARSYTRQYGEANPTFGYDVTSGSITSGTPTITCSATKTSPVGTYPIVISKGSVTNSTVNLVNGTLTISAGNYTKQEGEANPTFTPTFSGFKNNETKSVLTKQPTVTTTATTSSPAGTYPVTVSGAEAQNYSINYVNGTLTVTAKPSTGDIITFADAEVKRICVENWDTNKDGELSKTEAAAVKNLSSVVFNGNTTIKSFNELQFFTGLTSIGDQTFRDCSGLISITIPNSVTSIEGWAFLDCSGLTSVTIPNSVTSIGWNAFAHCSGLASVSIPNSVTSIGDGAFSECSSLTSVTIPNSVTSIGRNAFYGCTGLTFVTIPYSVTSIAANPFGDCTNMKEILVQTGNAYYTSSDNGVLFTKDMTEILAYPCARQANSYTIPNTVKVIRSGAFSGCSGLTSVTIPNSVTNIESSAFSGCSGLISITIPNSVTSIEGWVFSNCSGLTSVIIPSSVTSIGYGAFSGCSGLTSVTIPNSVTSIGSDAFRDCSGLTSVTIPNSVTSIGGGAFSGCSCLTSVTIPNSVTSIEGYVFAYCSGLTSVTIPNSVTSIGGSAFSGCSRLTSITIPNSVTSIGSFAFAWCSRLTEVRSMIKEPFEISSNCWNVVEKTIPLYVPRGTKEKYQSTDGWKRFTNIIEMEGTQPGDVNGDNVVDVADIASVISVMAKGNNDLSADVNGDGVVDVADIATIISEMAANARKLSIED